MPPTAAQLHQAELAALHLRNYWREEFGKRLAATEAASDALREAEEQYEAIRAQVAMADAPKLRAAM